MKKKICILYTGGTIGMVATENGYAPKKDYFSTELDQIDDLKADSMPDWEVVEFDPLLDSSNMAVEQWDMIGKAIEARYDHYDGFVILHGTDTMSYTASALSFMLENLDKPVILTGSQIPLCQIRSDGRDNLIASMLIAAEGVVKEVCLFFAGKLLRGNRSTKMSADELVAFTSPNYPPLAVAGIDIKYNMSALSQKPDADKSASGSLANDGKFHLRELKPVPIAVLKFFPGIQFSLFESIMTEKLHGIVLETFGAGNIPSNDNDLPVIIKKAFEKGSLVTVCSQCMQGTVKLGAYATSSPLKDAGAVSGYDMTTEAAVTKMYYLFNCHELNRDQIKELMEEDLRGELSK